MSISYKKLAMVVYYYIRFVIQKVQKMGSKDYFVTFHVLKAESRDPILQLSRWIRGQIWYQNITIFDVLVAIEAWNNRVKKGLSHEIEGVCFYTYLERTWKCNSSW